MAFGCNWDHHKLIRKYKLSIFEQGVHGGSVEQFIYKENQVFHTNRNCVIFGVPNNINHAAYASLLRKLMAPTQLELTAKKSDKYPVALYGGPFEVRRD